MPEDDPLSALGRWSASRLRDEAFTAQDLTAIAHEQGYASLNEGLLRIWVHRGLFPPARARLRAKGQPGVWYREDVVRLLDLCALNAANSRSDAAHLGLWLLSYDAPNENGQERVDVGGLLADQLARMERVLFGQVLEPTDGGSGAHDDETLDTIAAAIGRTIDGASHLDTLSSRLRPPPLPHLEELQDIHPDGCAGTTIADLEHATLPDAVLRPYRERQLQVLEHAVNWNRPAEETVERMRAVLDAIPRDRDGNLDIPLGRVTAGQRAELQRDIVALALNQLSGPADESSYTLPTLRCVVREAPDDDLRHARLLTQHCLMDALGWQRVFPDPALTGLARIGSEYRWDVRRLCAAPAFFPLAAYLVGAELYEARHPRSIRVRAELLPLALDQLARLARESVSRSDAFLSVALTSVPSWMLMDMQAALGQEVNT